MKVTAIQASPHRGNTYRRVEQFKENLLQLGDFEFDHIELAKVNLGQCRGCFSCFLNGSESCPLLDDGPMLLKKLRSSQAVVFATPVYSMHVSYLMKTFVDRFAFLFHRPEFFGKHAVGIAVTGGVGLKEALKYISMFAGSWGFNWLDEVRYADPPLGVKLPRFSEEKDRSGIAAARLASALLDERPLKPSFGSLMHFHMMRAVYARMADYLPRDHSYWQEKGWLDKGRKHFIPEARTGFFKPLVPTAAGLLMGVGIDWKMKKATSIESDPSGERKG